MNFSRWIRLSKSQSSNARLAKYTAAGLCRSARRRSPNKRNESQPRASRRRDLENDGTPAPAADTSCRLEIG